MNLRSEHRHGIFRVRVTDCGCGAADCDTLFLFATLHEVLWLAVGVGGPERMGEQVQSLLLDAQLDGEIPAMVAQGVALFGQAWRVLTSSRDRVLEQMQAFEAVPDWMMRVPVRDVWACRRVVFGEDLSRVPAALTALDDCYVHERPAVRRGG